MCAKHRSILIYFDNFHTVEDLPDEQLGVLFRAVMESAELEVNGQDGVTGYRERYPRMSDRIQMAYRFMMGNVRRDAAAYAEKCANYQSAAQRRAEQRQDAVPGKERLDALVRHMREEQKKPERPDWAAR